MSDSIILFDRESNRVDLPRLSSVTIFFDPPSATFATNSHQIFLDNPITFLFVLFFKVFLKFYFRYVVRVGHVIVCLIGSDWIFDFATIAFVGFYEVPVRVGRADVHATLEDFLLFPSVVGFDPDFTWRAPIFGEKRHLCDDSA